MKIELRLVSDLVPYARNARTHSDEQVGQLMGSLAEFGWTNPVLADATGIVSGHGRCLAAGRMYAQAKAISLPNGDLLPLGMVPVIDCTGWSDTKRRAYILTDNKTALNSGWDDELLALELGELEDMGFDLEIIGFSPDELAELNVGDEDGGDNSGDADEKTKGNLSDRFMIPPFSVLNAREGWWQNRKRAWLAIGLKSELGRGGTASTSARVGDDQPATYSPIGGKRQGAAPGQRVTTAKSSAAMEQESQ